MEAIRADGHCIRAAVVRDGKNGVPAGMLAAAANRKFPMPPEVARAMAAIASPAAVTPRGDVPPRATPTRTVKLTFCVVRRARRPNQRKSVSSPSGPSTWSDAQEHRLGDHGTVERLKRGQGTGACAPPESSEQGACVAMRTVCTS